LVGDGVAVENVAVAEHAGVPLGSELDGHLLLQPAAAILLRPIGGEVKDAIGVAGEVVELLGGARAAAKVARLFYWLLRRRQAGKPPKTPLPVRRRIPPSTRAKLRLPWVQPTCAAITRALA